MRARPATRSIGSSIADAGRATASYVRRRAPELLFTENETNVERLFGADGADGYVKDAFHDYVVHGDATR